MVDGRQWVLERRSHTTMDIKQNFRDHFFSYTIVALILMVGIFSYYRFMIKQDYLVAYEGTCDPAIETCFIGCEDDECTAEYYYSQMVKYAPDLYEECGEDINDCESANVCLSSDRDCSVTYCDPAVDGDDACAAEVSDQSDTDDTQEGPSQESEPIDDTNL